MSPFHQTKSSLSKNAHLVRPIRGPVLSTNQKRALVSDIFKYWISISWVILSLGPTGCPQIIFNDHSSLHFLLYHFIAQKCQNHWIEISHPITTRSVLHGIVTKPYPKFNTSTLTINEILTQYNMTHNLWGITDDYCSWATHRPDGQGLFSQGWILLNPIEAAEFF